MQRNKLKADLCAQVAQELGTSPADTARIVESQFAFAAQVMRRGDFDAITFPHLGKLMVKPARVQLLNNPHAQPL